MHFDIYWGRHLIPQVDGIRFGIRGLREFCGIQLCIVLHCCAIGCRSRKCVQLDILDLFRRSRQSGFPAILAAEGNPEA